MVQQNATGIMLQSLFRNWPKSHLSQIFFPAVAKFQPDLKFCGQTRMIDFCGRAHRFTDISDTGYPIRHNPETIQPMASRQQRSHRLAQALKRFRPVHNALRTGQEIWYANSWIGSVLQRQLRELNPEIVYTVAGNYCLTKISLSACRRLGFPMYFHTVDDFVTSLYSSMASGKYLQATSERWFRQMVDYASGLAAISSEMAVEFNTRYGKTWNWYTTLIDSNAYDPTPRNADGVIRLVYAGHLRIGRWATLKQLSMALESLHHRGIRTQLSIYAPPEELDVYGWQLKKGPNTKLRKWVPLNELPAIFHDADILVHAESFDPSVRELIKYSLSTKISQYMMASRCILAFGPESLSSIRLINETNAGFTVHDKNQELLATTLSGIFSRDNWRDCGQNGRRWALKNVEQQYCQKMFRKDLVRAIGVHKQRVNRSPQAILEPQSLQKQERQSCCCNTLRAEAPEANSQF